MRVFEIKRKTVDFLKLCLSFTVNLVFSISDVEAVCRCYDAKRHPTTFMSGASGKVN